MSGWLRLQEILDKERPMDVIKPNGPGLTALNEFLSAFETYMEQRRNYSDITCNWPAVEIAWKKYKEVRS